MLIRGKVALVIGGARGVGKAFVQHLLENGAKVVFGDVLDDIGRQTEAEFQKQHGEHNVLYQKCDITSSDNVEAIFTTAESKMCGKVEIVANAAGICKQLEWEKTVDVNVGGMIRLTTAALQHMSREHGGRGGAIVHVSSLQAVLSIPFAPVYAASKAAVMHYCKCYGVEEHFNVTGVRFNSLLPSMMDTEIVGEAYRPGNGVHFLEEILDMIKRDFELGNHHSTATCARALVRVLTEDLNGEAVVITPKSDFVLATPPHLQFEDDFYKTG